MAGEWIKMRCDLDSDPTVIAIAAQFGLSEDTVVGKLHKLWSWCSLQLRDGDARSVTLAWLDRFVGVTGFAEVLCREGWIEAVGNGFRIVNYDRHMSTNAKKRALTSARTKRWRDAERDADVTHRASPREEKRRVYTPTPLFDAFWSAYPNKAGRVAALKAWRRIDPNADLATAIMGGLADHQRRWTDPKFIPHAATWLNGRRWEDEAPASPTAKTAAERPCVF